MKILIDNGHGIETPGKRSPDAVKNKFSSPLYFREYKWCREVSCMICDLLQAEGFDAELLVPEIQDVSLVYSSPLIEWRLRSLPERAIAK